MKDYSEILKECARIAEERQGEYGHSSDSLKSICGIAESVFGIELTPEELALVFVSAKLSRESYKHKDDNIIDCINYLAIALNEMRNEKRKKN